MGNWNNTFNVKFLMEWSWNQLIFYNDSMTHWMYIISCKILYIFYFYLTKIVIQHNNTMLKIK